MSKPVIIPGSTAKVKFYSFFQSALTPNSFRLAGSREKTVFEEQDWNPGPLRHEPTLLTTRPPPRPYN